MHKQIDTNVSPSAKIRLAKERRIPMAEIFVTCPYTCREVPTGIEIDLESFHRLPEVLTRSTCPHCGLPHDWAREDAYLGERPTAA
jgi:hypothetical protein